MYAWESNRNLITKVDYLALDDIDCPTKIDYSYDELCHPSSRKDYFNTFEPDLIHLYTYNSRSELIGVLSIMHLIRPSLSLRETRESNAFMTI